MGRLESDSALADLDPMTARVVPIAELADLTGQTIGRSPWRAVTQDDVNAYADSTDDHQWFCEDVERARSESPFGGTVAPGYFILALAPGLLKKIWYVEGARMGMNYGINQLRFPAPLRVGQRVRLSATLSEVRPVENGQEVVLALRFDANDQERPVCVAEVVYLFV